MVFYDFVEIGTSDFDTEIQKKDSRTGISIEPVKYYLDRLPNKEGCVKLNIGISNRNGKSVVYYIPEENIKKYRFESYVRGCNSIDSYHATIVRVCKEKNLDIEKMCNNYEIVVETLHDTLNKMDVHGLYYLKIDTEGHDTVILKKFYEDLTDNRELPHVILFESNILSKTEDVKEVINLFSTKGYDLLYSEGDTKLQLNLKKLSNKSGFAPPMPNYYIMDYPAGYDTKKLPHENTLEAAKEYCIAHNCSGVTLQEGVYQVRDGKYMRYFKQDNLLSWVFL